MVAETDMYSALQPLYSRTINLQVHTVHTHSRLITHCSWHKTHILPHWLTDRHMDGWMEVAYNLPIIWGVCVHDALMCPHVTRMDE